MAHALIYLYLLIEHDILPKSVADNVHLLSSQQYFVMPVHYLEYIQHESISTLNNF